MIKTLRAGAISILLGAAAAGATGAGAADIDRDFLLARVEADRDASAALADNIWDLAELGYLESQSSALLRGRLEEAGFAIETGVADIPTAFVAAYRRGRGGPVIAILAEFDALPGISQDRSPTRSIVPGKSAGHACGHHLLGAGSVSAALAVAAWMEDAGVDGEIRLYGTPAEEGGSGKVYMTRAGLFDDVDTVLHWHPNDENTANPGSNLANRSARFTFSGVSAHAAAAPERGRSALDGVESMNFMANMMREHMPQDARMHYVITEGGHAPNVVPDRAQVYYYLRHPDVEELESLWVRLEETARAGALGTGTTVDIEIMHGNRPLLMNDVLQRRLHANLSAVGGVTYSPVEQAFAEELYSSFDRPRGSLGDQADVQPYQLQQSYGSTDVGDISWVTPTGGLTAATWVPGTSAHSWQAIAAGGMSIGHQGMEVAAKALALTAAELMTDEDLRAAAQAEFEERRGDDFVYYPLLGDRDPPLEYRVSGD